MKEVDYENKMGRKHCARSGQGLHGGQGVETERGFGLLRDFFLGAIAHHCDCGRELAF